MNKWNNNNNHILWTSYITTLDFLFFNLYKILINILVESFAGLHGFGVMLDQEYFTDLLTSQYSNLMLAQASARARLYL